MSESKLIRAEAVEALAKEFSAEDHGERDEQQLLHSLGVSHARRLRALLAQSEEPGDVEQLIERLREDTCSEDDEGVPFYDASLADGIIREALAGVRRDDAEAAIAEARDAIARAEGKA